MIEKIGKKISSINNQLYFSASDGIHGTELWHFDGSNLSLIQDIRVGNYGANPRNIMEFNGILYFSARDFTHGTELWKYDGTSTTMIYDIKRNTSGSNPSNLYAHNSSLYFSANGQVSIHIVSLAENKYFFVFFHILIW